MALWSRGRGVARDVLRSLPKLGKYIAGMIFSIGERSRLLIACFLYSRGQMFFSQTPGRRPPHITGLRVNSVTLPWVRAPNERAPFRVHDAIASFADRCLTRTRIARRPGFGWGFMNTEQLRVSCPGEFYTKMKNVRICPATFTALKSQIPLCPGIS